MQASLYAVACVEDSLAQACEHQGQKIGQSLLRLLVGGWQMLTPDLVREAVYTHLQELYMKVVSGLMSPLMGLLGSDVSQRRVRFLPAHIDCNFSRDHTSTVQGPSVFVNCVVQ
jgi:hypothetical protein